ncbi:MAG: MFS transporter, partial [Rectinemataceae bacterium]
NTGYSAVGAILGLVMMVTALITFASVREPDHSKEPKPTERFFETFLAVFKNRHYVIVLLTYALNLTALTFVQGILAYYFKYLYRNEAMTTLAMVLLLVTAMFCIPISVFVSKRIGKKKTYQFSLAMLAISCIAIFFLGHILGMNFFIAMMVFAGIGIGFGYVAPYAMVPDTVEFDAIKTGKRKEGAFYGMWTFTSKVGTSLAIALTGVILSLANYIAPSTADLSPFQPESTLFAIRMLIGPIPALTFIAAIVLVQFYALDEKTYAKILAEGKATS